MKYESILRKEIQLEECQSFHKRYLDKIDPDTSLLVGLLENKDKHYAFYKNIPSKKYSFRYAENKWSIKEVLQHIIDTERVFIYRCLRLARKDPTPMAGFEQDDYILPSHAHAKSKDDLLDEYIHTRAFSISVVKSLRPKEMQFIGTASGYTISARAAAFMILGHEVWHVDILKEKYLK